MITQRSGRPLLGQKTAPADDEPPVEFSEMTAELAKRGED